MTDQPQAHTDTLTKAPPSRPDDPLARPASRELRPLLALLPFLRPYRGRIVIALVALAIAAGASLAVPAAVKEMIDLGFSRDHADDLGIYFLGLLGVALVLALATATRFYYVTWIGERLVADLRREVYAHVVGLSPEFVEVTRTGEVLSRLTTDTALIQTVVGSSASMALRSMVTLIGGMGLMVYTSPWLSLMAGIVVPATVLPLIIFGRMVRRLSRDSQDRIADSSAMANESLSAIQIVQAFTREAEERRRFAASVERSFDTAVSRTFARAGLTAIVILIVFGAIVGLLWHGASQVIAGELTAGTLSQFVLYAVLVAGSVGTLAEVWGDIQRASGATERLIELLNIPIDIAAPKKPQHLPTPIQGAVSFHAVTFTYAARPERSALRDINIDIRPGETVAIVGPSGAGKTTIFQLLLRFRDPTIGAITIDGIDIRDLDPTELRRTLGLVPQDTILFAGSVADNIRYGRLDASDEDVEAAAKVAAAHDFITALPDGHATQLGERGARLSGGQRQRIAIARAVLKNPQVMLLDEATSSLDTESERLIQDAFEILRKDRTTLVIAHRLSTVQGADRIIVLEDGRVVETGRHDDLINAGGLYTRLAAVQFAGA